MTTSTAATTRPLDQIWSSGTAPVAERAAYVYVGNGMFRPANDAAHEECRRWNAYADAWNARTAARSL